MLFGPSDSPPHGGGGGLQGGDDKGGGGVAPYMVSTYTLQKDQCALLTMIENMVWGCECFESLFVRRPVSGTVQPLKFGRVSL